MNDRELVQALLNTKSRSKRKLLDAAARRIIALLAENDCPYGTSGCAINCEACWRQYLLDDKEAEHGCN